jgi:DNA-binding protein HU-beta
MTKKDIINIVAENTEVKKGDVEKVVNGVLEAIETALVNGDNVQFTGFGTFEVRDRAAREGRNPKTGETLTIPASKSPAFKAGKALKTAVNG